MGGGGPSTLRARNKNETKLSKRVRGGGHRTLARKRLISSKTSKGAINSKFDLFNPGQFPVDQERFCSNRFSRSQQSFF